MRRVQNFVECVRLLAGSYWLSPAVRPEIPMPPDELIRILHASYSAPGEGITDAELLVRFAVGKDDAAFELLMRRHADMVWRVCRSVVRDSHDAEDAFQATFFLAARNATAFSGRGSAAGWLYRIARHTALKSRAYRVPSQHSAAILDSMTSADPPDAALAEIARLLHEELDRLPEKYRAPLVLCYLEGHSHAEVARDLGWPIGTVATRIARGRERLRDRLTRRGASLSVTGVAAALSAGSASAAPPTLVATTVGAIAVGTLSPTVHHLARGVQPLMSPTRIAPLGALVAGFVLAVGAVLAFAVRLRAHDARYPVVSRRRRSLPLVERESCAGCRHGFELYRSHALSRRSVELRGAFG